MMTEVVMPQKRPCSKTPHLDVQRRTLGVQWAPLLAQADGRTALPLVGGAAPPSSGVREAAQAQSRAPQGRRPGWRALAPRQRRSQHAAAGRLELRSQAATPAPQAATRRAQAATLCVVAEAVTLCEEVAEARRL